MRAFTVRVDDDVVEKLDAMCALSGVKRPEYISNLIRLEHDKLQGSPKVRALIEQMKALADQVKNLQIDTKGE
jgi:metal-responsive CopG/Arc/MetJ family transcriptional regulator